jgi:predicted deoxyguanosinetriphosphate triphosphohydrolase
VKQKDGLIDRKIKKYVAFVAAVERNLDKNAATFSTEAVRLDGSDPVDEYRKHLAEAKKEDGSFGDEAKFGARTPFQIDRDRILYSPFFAPLALKTQMIIGQHTSLLKNRLSHTLIVANIARSIAQGLRLNSDLTEAIALGHDIGHAPFGHAGERTLNEWLTRRLFEPRRQTRFVFLEVLPGASEHFLLQENEAAQTTEGESLLFRHGRQSVKKLEILADEKPANLTRKALFGIWRHSGSLAMTDASFSYVFPDDPIRQLGGEDSSYEAQVVRLADDIAWVVHDLDDAFQAKILEERTVLGRKLYLDKEDSDWLVSSVLHAYALGPWVRKFISGVVEENRELDKARRDDPEYHLRLTPPLQAALNSLRGLIIDTVQEHEETQRAEEAVDLQLSGLADAYWRASREFAVDLRRVYNHRGHTRSGLQRLMALVGEQDWGASGKGEADRKSEDPRDGGIPAVKKAALICDFLSALTDEEAVLLWEWRYSPRFRLAPAATGHEEPAK